MQKTIKMGHLAINNKILDKYFRFLLNLDKKSKKRLVNKLLKSIELNKEKKIDLKVMYGAWTDDKDSDEIIKEIEESRIEETQVSYFI